MNKQLNIFNTLSGKKEKFVPINTGKVGMYVCGPTVYDFPHIGNARPLVVFDVLFRLLKKLNNVIGFIGIAAVIDFTKYKMWNKFSHKIKKKLKKGKIHYLKNNYGGSYPISLKLITNSNKCLLINKKIKANFPIKLFIGKKDNIVTLKDTLDIYNILKTKNKEILVQNEGDHSLSKLKDLNRIAKVILSFF